MSLRTDSSNDDTRTSTIPCIRGVLSSKNKQTKGSTTRKTCQLDKYESWWSKKRKEVLQRQTTIENIHYELVKDHVRIYEPICFSTPGAQNVQKLSFWAPNPVISSFLAFGPRGGICWHKFWPAPNMSSKYFKVVRHILFKINCKNISIQYFKLNIEYVCV
jgi:hypothetical protein